MHASATTKNDYDLFSEDWPIVMEMRWLLRLAVITTKLWLASFSTFFLMCTCKMPQIALAMYIIFILNAFTRTLMSPKWSTHDSRPKGVKKTIQNEEKTTKIPVIRIKWCAIIIRTESMANGSAILSLKCIILSRTTHTHTSTNTSA